MNCSTSIVINRSAPIVWKAICDIKNCDKMVSAINKLEMINQPDDGLIGLKWKETRTVFGKAAEETMWIVEAEENVFYQTRAESHGSIYKSEMRIEPINDSSVTLIMSFDGQAQTLLAKIMSAIMMPFFKGSMITMLNQDLNDIKVFIENQND